MKISTQFRSMALVLSLGLILQGCDAAKKAIDEASELAPEEIVDFVGYWRTSCVATTDIDGSPAYTRSSISINIDGTGNYIIGYYSNGTCTTSLLYMLTPVVWDYQSDTTSPANGKLFHMTATSGQTIASQNAAGGNHLTSVCPNAFGANSGVSTDGSYNCSDNRFDFASVGTIGEIVLVKTSSTQVDTTSVFLNMPGQPVGSAAAFTSLTWN